MPHHPFQAVHFSLLLAAALLSGCGGSDAPETGTVSGTITVNGKPVEGIQVKFVPEAQVRPSVGTTNAEGEYTTKLTEQTAGVALGPCVVQFFYYPGESSQNILPAKYNEAAADNPDLNLTVPDDGIVFDYDITVDGEFPPSE